MSIVSKGLTLPKAIHLSSASSQKSLRSVASNISKVNEPVRRYNSTALVRVGLIHLGNVRTRALLAMRNIKTQDDLIQGPRNVMEEKHQENQNIVNQTLSKITSKLTSLISKKNFLTEGTHRIQNSTTVSNAAFANQNVYPLTGNIAASTDTNIALALQADQTPSQAAINIINISAPELVQQLPVALEQSIKTLGKMGEKFSQQPINASLL